MKQHSVSNLFREASDAFSPDQLRRRRRSRETRAMLRGVTVGAGAGTLVGLLLMFLFDPRQGAHRRARLKDGVSRTARSTGSAVAGGAGFVTMPFHLFKGKSTGKRIEVSKTFLINAPVEKVYAFWSRFDNFPQFMHHVRSVTALDENSSHWVVEGPAGTRVEWDAEITRQIENRIISWRSRRGSQIDNVGTVRFTPSTDGSTRVHVQISYAPPAGRAGHAIAALFGTDPQSEMDDDLNRMKELLENVNTR